MSIYQAPREKRLRAKLEAEAGAIRFVPKLESRALSLNNQPAAAALLRMLSERRQIVLEGPAGSGKTVLALSFALSDRMECAYLEAPAWLPDSSSGLDEFLIAAGCDHQRAIDALNRGTLALVIDAVDEAPWTSSGQTVLDALVRLSQQVDGRAGLLVTSRTSRQVPPLPSSRPAVTAALAGIAEEEVEAFLAHYAGGRTGTSEIAASLRTMPFPPTMRYSPLVLRQFAEGLSVENVPTNSVQLFERMAEFHIARECEKALDRSRPGVGSWQERYSSQDRHRALVTALAFGTGQAGRTLPEAELEEIVRSILEPTTFGARPMVELSTLMSQHPLVVVTYLGSSPDGQDEQYRIERPPDWARIGLFPRFLSSDLIGAQVQAVDTWHEAVPYHADFAPGWRWLDTSGRLDESLSTLEELCGTSEQARTIAAWLGAQVFSREIAGSIPSRLFAVMCALAAKFASPRSDLTEQLGLGVLVAGPLVLEGQAISLTRADQFVNFTGLSINRTDFIVGPGGPTSFLLGDCSLVGVRLDVQGPCSVEISRCYLEGFSASVAPMARLVVRGCLIDVKSTLPESTQGLESCDFVDASADAEILWALAEILRKLVQVGERPELAKKKTNVNEDHVYEGLVARYADAAKRTVGKMIGLGYLVRKPTGSVQRLDPTTKFDAAEASRFIARPIPRGAGPMTQRILSELGIRRATSQG